VSATSQLHSGEARRVFVDLRGRDGSSRRIAALQSGEPERPPVLLVPGFTGSKEDFGPILDPIGAAGFFATAIDLPGQFESPGLPAPADYTPDRLGAVVRAIAELLGPRVRLLGHSFGGLVARAAVIGEPSAFESVVLLCSGPAELGGARRATIEDLEPLLASVGLPGLYAAMQAAALADPSYVAPPPDVEEFLERRFLRGSPAMMQGMAEALRREPDRVAELAATDVPVLVAHGIDDDAWPPVEQKDMASRLAAGYEVIAECAHSPAVENPAATVAVLTEFWNS
jgi:pimeloyl-ACP methyl ester carboxylesterase